MKKLAIYKSLKSVLQSNDQPRKVVYWTKNATKYYGRKFNDYIHTYI